LLADARDALAYAEELRQQAQQGADVVGELEQESKDSLDRAIATRRYARRGFPELCRILHLDGESASIRQEIASRVGRPPLGRQRYRFRAMPYRPKVLAAADFIAKHSGTSNASRDEILRDPAAAKSAYRRASLRLHPDRGGDSRLMQ